MAKQWIRALVTGASSGIGYSFARLLAAQGTNLVLVARNREALEALAEVIREDHAVEVEVLVADLSDPEQRATVETRLLASTDPVDLLVNNAGHGYHGAFGTIPVDDEDAEIQVNITALMRLSHAAVTRFKTLGGGGKGEAPVGGILNVSSTASFQPGINFANYAATKAYVTSFSQALHEELGGQGITVTVVCPGLTRTEFQKRSGTDVSLPDFVWQTPDEVAQVGLDAVAAERAFVVSGAINKALQFSIGLAPVSVARWASARVLGRVR